MFTSTLVLMKNPAGTWHFVGRVPMTLGFERRDGQPLTEEDIEVIQHCGPGLRKKEVKTRTFLTSKQGLRFAKEKNFTVTQVCK